MKSYIYIALILCLSSCGLFRKVHKESFVDKVSSSSIVKSDSTGSTIDKSVTTIKERVDTTVIIPAKTITQETYFNMDSLVNGMTAVRSTLIDISFALNPVTHKLTTTATLKPQLVPIKIDKETTKQNNITSSGKVSKSQEQKSSNLHKASTVDKKPANSIWFVVIILGSVLITGWLAYRYLKR